jgi:hypothetical protein
MTEIKDSEILDRALGVLAEPELWCQGHFRILLDDGRLAHCGEGAIHRAVVELSLAEAGTAAYDEVYRERFQRIKSRVLGVLREMCPLERGRRRASLDERIALYNDDPSMDHPTILAAFEKSRNAALEEGN